MRVPLALNTKDPAVLQEKMTEQHEANPLIGEEHLAFRGDRVTVPHGVPRSEDQVSTNCGGFSTRRAWTLKNRRARRENCLLHNRIRKMSHENGSLGNSVKLGGISCKRGEI
jgi:hypothetical protein